MAKENTEQPEDAKKGFIADALIDSTSSDPTVRMRGKRDLNLTESTVGKGRNVFSRAPVPEREAGLFTRTNESVIEEEGRVHSREEIMSLIEGIAQHEGVDPRSLVIEKEVLDAQERLVALHVRVKEETAQELGYAQYVYDYMIKGQHGGVGFANVTQISRAVSRPDAPDEFVAGGTVGEYKDGKWQLAPGSWAHRADDVDPMES